MFDDVIRIHLDIYYWAQFLCVYTPVLQLQALFIFTIWISYLNVIEVYYVSSVLSLADKIL